MPALSPAGLKAYLQEKIFSTLEVGLDTAGVKFPFLPGIKDDRINVPVLRSVLPAAGSGSFLAMQICMLGTYHSVMDCSRGVSRTNLVPTVGLADVYCMYSFVHKNEQSSIAVQRSWGFKNKKCTPLKEQFAICIYVIVDAY